MGKGCSKVYTMQQTDRIRLPNLNLNLHKRMKNACLPEVILDTVDNLPLDIEEEHAISVLNRRQHEHTKHSTWIIPSLCKRDNFFY
ncbi:hypothetical protein POTOM_013776 [Populus tomentosa]|uniref:Uncharacterized protein n=1 Tax=Populus tomentosa TaxID=118781 RepID=A0A8X8A6F5_POPTO|nr:hypothetical protein POTOM_013776 [Populus tomentosa]